MMDLNRDGGVDKEEYLLAQRLLGYAIIILNCIFNLH